MEDKIQRSFSLRLNRRNQTPRTKDTEGGRFSQDYPMKIVWKRGFIRLVLVAGIVWMLLILFVLLIHVWSCQSSVVFFSAICNKQGKVFIILDTMGFVPKPQHRCPVPVADEPNRIVIPKERTPNNIVKNLTYIMEEVFVNNGSQSFPLFGGNQSWSQREESFKLNSTMKVHCGFMRNGGAEMSSLDVNYVKKCRFVVASGIFDGYDVPPRPTNISHRSKKLFCFLMMVDEESLTFIKKNVTVREDSAGGQWVGIWRLVLLKNPPYDEPRRNGKVPKILTHRLFPQAQYSIWIDGKMELIVDPLLILERYLWRNKNTFAIAQHKHHRSIYEEADANKRRKRYARPLINLHMKIYRYEGMETWSIKKNTVSDVPEGAVIIREHTAMSNLFSCLWFNEVNLFTPRDQLSFGYVVYRLGGLFKFYMFPNCEYNSLFVLHPHTREHSSKIEWVKNTSELTGKGSSMKESRGGLGLWTPYPGNLNSVVLPPVARTSKAG
ncbi:probable hexosyltransferase MUCI70 isoform X1 [Mangifera indica]|uniref:probable hexosyltransferase MUCI70 isoform X1 n=1 Tax=Mangifera indica TaxID=29780 RepID=UPI001CF95B88|nr:probable hexosyltransferase MUCI70 isoform X1 [Mangifera indica]